MQHVFAYVDFHQKLDRMFTYDLKKKRYYVDDPYEKYNKMSFLKQKYALEKNRILIEEHGNQMYNFDRYRMHMDRYEFIPFLYFKQLIRMSLFAALDR